jgi:hypothetical protein
MVSPIAEIPSLSSAIYHARSRIIQKSSCSSSELEKPSAETRRYSFSFKAGYGLDIRFAG